MHQLFLLCSLVPLLPFLCSAFGKQKHSKSKWVKQHKERKKKLGFVWQSVCGGVTLSFRLCRSVNSAFGLLYSTSYPWTGTINTMSKRTTTKNNNTFGRLVSLWEKYIRVAILSYSNHQITVILKSVIRHKNYILGWDIWKALAFKQWPKYINLQ